MLKDNNQNSSHRQMAKFYKFYKFLGLWFISFIVQPSCYGMEIANAGEARHDAAKNTLESLKVATK